MEARSGALPGRIIYLMLALFALYLIILNVVFSFKNNVLIYAVAVIPVYIVVWLIAYKTNFSPLAFAVAIFVLAFLSKGIFAAVVKAIPFSDFDIFYQNALKLFSGDKSFGNTFYFRTWAYQTGPIIYYSGLMKLFGTGLLPLKLANAFFMAGTNVFVYLISRKISNDYTARFVSILYLIYPAPYFLAAVLTNQHFAACMFLAAICILCYESLNIALRGLISGILIAAGNAVRPLGLVIIGALIIWSIIETIHLKNFIKIITVAVILVAYISVNFGISYFVKSSGINGSGLVNNFPLWKFVVGLNYESKGQFSYEDQNKIFYIDDFTERNSMAKKVIKERISVQPARLIDLFNSKQTIMWANFDTLRWEFYKKVDGKLIPGDNIEKYEPYALGAEKIYYILVFMLMTAGLLEAIFRKKPGTFFTFLSVLLLCYFGAHVLIEIQVRYRYFAVILVFILAAKGSERLFGRYTGKRRSLQSIA